jgi:hypothetical protein
MPILMGGALLDHGALDAVVARELRASILTETALDERIDMALSALAAPPGRRQGESG